jgi:hypothetical protein
MRAGNNIDLARNQLLNARLQNLAVDPAGLTAADKGLIWIDAGGVIKFWDGDSIESLGVLGAGAPPSGPAGGELAGAYPNPTIADGVIDNANVAANAAIAQSKLALSITNAEVAAGAAIDLAKLAVDPRARATHTGTQLAATISDFAASARAAMDKATIDALAVDAGTVDGFEGAALEKVANKNQANGYAGLGADGKIPDGLIPALAIGEPFVVTSQAEMLALNAQAGDVAKRTDLGRSFMLRTGGNPTVLADWIALTDAAGGVQSVQGDGTVVQSTGGANPVISIAANSIGAGLLADGSVGTGEIQDAAVTNAKIVSVDVSKVTGALRKAVATAGDGAATTIVINHNLGTQDVIVSIRDAASGEVRLDDWKPTDNNNISLTYGVAPAANSIRVTVIG